MRTFTSFRNDKTAISSAALTVAGALACFASYKLIASSFGVSNNNKRKGIENDGSFKQDRIIVISGCDTGFGRLLAETLVTTVSSSSSYNYIVVALTLSEQGAKDLNAFEESSSVNNSSNNKKLLYAIQCDVTSQTDIDKMKIFVQGLLQDQHAVLYSIVNNAGITENGDFVWFKDTTAHKRVMDVNYFGQLNVTCALLPLMIPMATYCDARIINMSSVCGTSASPMNGPYNASKFAVEAWSDSLRLELEPMGIVVTKIRPGQTNTNIQSDWKKKCLSTFDNASTEIQERYGGKEQYKSYLSKTMDANFVFDTMPKPEQVVNTMVNILTTITDPKQIKPSYWVGPDANTFWYVLSCLPTSTSDSIKRALRIKNPYQQPKEAPPHDVISHVAIRVSNLKRSIEFYKSFGLVEYGDPLDGKQFLKSGSSKTYWDTLVLLEEDTTMTKPRGGCYEAGMTRLCIYKPTGLVKEIERLEKEQGIKPIAPMVNNGGEKLVVYKDPDGFTVYMVEFLGFMGAFVRSSLWWNSKKLPCLFHWTINVTDIKNVLPVFEKLGFDKVADLKSDEVHYDLLPPFNIDEKSSIIEYIRLCKLPKDGFIATLMEWTTPKSEKKGQELMNTMTISVDNVHDALVKARNAGMIVNSTEQPKYKNLPVYGKVLVGTAYVEEGCNPIEFCCFTNKP